MTRARLLDAGLYTLAILTLLSFIAACLVVSQGFGGGHGSYDLAIFFLGLPCSLLLPLIPEALFSPSDLFNVVALPWLMNSAVVLTLYLAARPFVSPKQTYEEKS